MSNQRLPLELVDIVIDHLYYDRPTLAACCLVCKAWLPSSRYHLLSDTRIDYWTSDKILKSQQISTVATYVRRLMVCHMHPLPAGIEVFSSITSLFIYGCLPYAQMRMNLPFVFSKVTYLEVYDVNFQSFGDMVELFCSFPKLQTLSLSCTWETDGGPHNHLRPPSTLHTLNIRGGTRAVLPWFTRFVPDCQLSTLRVFRLATKHVEILEDTLLAFGGSIRHLELGLRSHRNAGAFVDKICLRHNTSLEYLMLHNAPLLLFQSVLQSALRNSKVREAHLITSQLEKVAPINHPGWSLLDHAVANAVNHRLSNLTFRLDVVRADFRDLIIHEIKRQLPLCTTRGIVRFVSEKERMLGMRQRMSGPVSARSWGDMLVY